MHTTPIFWDADSETCTFSAVGNQLANLDQYGQADRCFGSIFEALEAGEVIELAEGFFELNGDLSLGGLVNAPQRG